MSKISTHSPDRLDALIHQLARRQQVRNAWILAQQSLWWPALAALILLGLARFFPIENRMIWTASPVFIWGASILVYLLYSRHNLLEKARRVDLELGLKERLSTALHFEKNVVQDDPAGLVRRQRKDALEVAAKIDPANAFPLPWLRRPWAMTMLFIAALALLSWLPNPMDQVLAERAAVREEAAVQAEHIEQLKEEISADTSLSPEDRDRLLRELEELARQLRNNPGDLAKALADISRLEAALRQQVDPNAGYRQNALAELAQQLESLASSMNENQEEISGLAEALQQLAEQLSSQDEQTRQEAAQTLSQLASRTAMSGDQSLAQALASLAQAAQSGDPSALSEAAQAVQGEFSQAQSEAAAQQALENALNQLAQSRQSLSQSSQQMASNSQPGDNSGQNSSNQLGNQPDNQPGNQPGSQPGSQPGNQPGNQPGQGQTAGPGGGSQANTLPPASSSGQAGTPNLPGQSSGLEDFSSQVYVPFERRPSEGDEFFIPGQDTGQGETQTRQDRSPLPGAYNPALLPYYQVYGSYLNAAGQAVDQGYIPVELRDFVREYFSRLEP